MLKPWQQQNTPIKLNMIESVCPDVTHPSMNDSAHLMSRENEIINLTIHRARVHILSNTKQR